MPNEDETLTFRTKELKGSRLRCLMLTSLPNHEFANFLTNLVAPHAVVTTKDKWMPNGFLSPEEAKLGESQEFLSHKEDRDEVTGWWLKAKKGANTPNWDIASTCTIGTTDGLILIEAKAHEDELKVKSDNCGSSNPRNQEQIRFAIKQANSELNTIVRGWSLSEKKCYQLSNRFAWAWKVASLGIPVILVYLGFLNAKDMNDGKYILLSSDDQWRRCVIDRSAGIVPRTIWGKKIEIGGGSLVSLIRTADVNVRV